MPLEAVIGICQHEAQTLANDSHFEAEKSEKELSETPVSLFHLKSNVLDYRAKRTETVPTVQIYTDCTVRMYAFVRRTGASVEVSGTADVQ